MRSPAALARPRPMIDSAARFKSAMRCEQFVSRVTDDELHRVHATPEGDGQQQRAVPVGTADPAMPERIDRQWKQNGWRPTMSGSKRSDIYCSAEYAAGNERSSAFGSKRIPIV